MIIERRKSLRETLQLPVNEIFPQRCDHAVITNLSDKGLCYQKPFFKLQEKGSEVTFTVCLNSACNGTEVKGKIVHQYIYGNKLVTGVTFSNLPATAREELKQLLNSRVTL